MYEKLIGTTMDIVEILQGFKKDISAIVLDQRDIRDSIRKEIEALCEQEETGQQAAIDATLAKSIHNMFFQDFETGNFVCYGHYSLDICDLKNNIRYRKNRQYQWLLAEAYEKFEQLIEHAYAFLGKKEYSFWADKDYGNYDSNDMEKYDFGWYVNRAHHRKNGAIGILNKFYNEFDINIQWDDLPLRFYITSIEKMRHIIVHKRGTVSDKDIFLKKIISDAGISINDKRYDKMCKFLEAYFLDQKHPNTIFLLEIRNNIGPLPTLLNIFELLTSVLLNAAYRICAECEFYAMGKGFDLK